MWNLYFDESSHDFRLSEKTFFTENFLDSYIGVYVGILENNQSNIFKMYDNFEMKYKKYNQEFKGTSLAKNQLYKYGIATFDGRLVALYSDFFSVLKKIDFLSVLMLSKFEQNLKSLIDISKLHAHYASLIPDKNLADTACDVSIYSLIKFLYVYRNNELQQVIYDKGKSTQDKIIEIKSFMSSILEKDSDVDRKSIEKQVIPVMQNILDLDIFTTRIDNRFYSQDVLKGVNSLLEHHSLDASFVNMYPDKGAQIDFSKFNFNKYEEQISENSVGIRIADIFSHFLYKIAVAFENDIAEKFGSSESDESFENLKIISDRWFDFDKEKFELYYKVSGTMDKLRKSNNLISGLYFDQIDKLYTLFAYMYQYNTYEEYDKFTPNEHRDKFHSFEMDHLQRVYQDKGWS